MKLETVTSFEQAIENIAHYQVAIEHDSDIRARVARVWSWYAVKDKDSSRWKFAPSKFIGYRDADARKYLAGSGLDGELDGRITERLLAEWFYSPPRGSRLERELLDALRTFLARFGKAPGARARINVPRESVPIAHRLVTVGADLLDRIASNPEICGGRPCIKGTRMRVADIVESLAHGTSQKELLADFDYLTEDDIAAALLYAARATDHRIVRTA
jgi:uncharacterized protein (DUF433 family)